MFVAIEGFTHEHRGVVRYFFFVWALFARAKCLRMLAAAVGGAAFSCVMSIDLVFDRPIQGPKKNCLFSLVLYFLQHSHMHRAKQRVVLPRLTPMPHDNQT